MHGIQAWVALPDALEETDPAFAHYGAADMPTLAEARIRGRLIAGSAFGATAGVRTHSPMFYAHWNVDAGAVTGPPADQPERAAHVASGRVEVDGRSWRAGQMLVFAPGKTVIVKAEEPSTVMVLGGEPVGPRYLWWNFVSSSQDCIEQAKADWKAGRFALPPHDHDEIIPLPEP